MAARRILVVEDEEAIAASIVARLRTEGFEVEIARDGPTGVERARTWMPDLILLDVMLPGLDGIEVCREIQRHRPVPVLMLTARDAESDVLVGLGVGADDYMTKPFSPRELSARISALLRRVDRAPAPPGAPAKVDGLEVDPATRRVVHEGEEIHLTPTEFDLLYALAIRPGVVMSRERLLTDVWGYRDGLGARTVDSHVRALRRKLRADLIRTVHGIGYAIEVPA